MPFPALLLLLLPMLASFITLDGLGSKLAPEVENMRAKFESQFRRKCLSYPFIEQMRHADRSRHIVFVYEDMVTFFPVSARSQHFKHSFHTSRAGQ